VVAREDMYGLLSGALENQRQQGYGP